MTHKKMMNKKMDYQYTDDQALFLTQRYLAKHLNRHGHII